MNILPECPCTTVTLMEDNRSIVTSSGRLIISLLTGENFTDSSAIPSEDAYKNLSKGKLNLHTCGVYI